MRTPAVVSTIFFPALLLLGSGCEPASVRPSGQPALPPKTENGSNVSMYPGYTAAKIDILPLTEFISPGPTEEPLKLRVYVSLLDPFDCQIKSPGVFRFELYEHVPRSAEPKGKRIAIWPDIDLTDAVENNNYWRDFLRTYEFNLPVEPLSNPSYVLQATFLCPSGRRLSAEFTLRHTQ